MDNSTQKSSELAVEDAAPASTKSAKEVSKREGHKSDEAKTTLKKEKKINNREDDAASSQSDGDHKDPKSKVAVPTKKVLVAAPKNKVESSDDSKSDDSSSSDDDKIIPPTLGKKPAAVPEKAVDPSDSSSDSSSDEENGQKNNVKMAASQPRKLPSTTVKNVSVAIVKKKDESNGSSEELLEDEDALATKLVPSKRSSSATETKESKQEEACLKEADSDSSSEEEPQRKKMKAQPTVTPNAGKQSAKKATQNGSSSDEGSHDDEPTKAQSLRRSSPTRVAKKRSESEDECSEDNSSSEEDTSEEEHEKPSKSPNSKSPNKNDSDVDMVNAVSLKTESRQADAEFGKKVPQTPVTQVQTEGSKTLFVANLSFSVEQTDVEDFFKDAGEIVQIRFALDYEGAFKGYGHVEFATVAAAQKALKLDGQDLLGRRVRLDLAKERGSYTSNSGMERNSYQKSGRAPGQTIFIRGFDKSSGEDQVRSALEEHFASCGGISRVTIPKNYVGDELKGIAYIDFKDSDSFNKALELNGSELGGYTLMVEEAKRRVDNRDYTGSGRGGERSSGRYGAGRFGESGGRFGGWW
ncbi:nucleolin 2-like isoform X10 [Camellia sinensis]|uniref:nucleolin 2-like isoform X10 n=1 Tax=Camellia sinensis TaxID=4442 RepID=UPI0010368BA0|nr:nucleolin 2-like isoform X10 [Camellia sinensis]